MAFLEAIGDGGSSEVYSTTETRTGKVWIDGKPIYRKVIEFTGNTANGWNGTGVTAASLGCDTIVSFVGLNNVKSCMYPLFVEVQNGEIKYNTTLIGFGMSGAIIEYTKA